MLAQKLILFSRTFIDVFILVIKKSNGKHVTETVRDEVHEMIAAAVTEDGMTGVEAETIGAEAAEMIGADETTGVVAADTGMANNHIFEMLFFTFAFLITHLFFMLL